LCEKFKNTWLSGKFSRNSQSWFWNITNFIFWFWFLWKKIWNLVVMIIQFSVKWRSIHFYNNFHIHIIVWIFCNIKI
jgi:hypothetical protein